MNALYPTPQLNMLKPQHNSIKWWGLWECLGHKDSDEGDHDPGKPGFCSVADHAYNHRSQDVKAGGSSKSSRPALATKEDCDQPGLHETWC